MKCALHIGTETTATTTLDFWLYDNKDALAKQGIALSEVIGRPNNRNLVGFVGGELRDSFFRSRMIFSPEQREDFYKDFDASFRAEIERVRREFEPHTFIITSKHFHSCIRKPHEIERLRDFLLSVFDDIRVVLTVREQSEMALCLYSRALRTGHAGTLQAFSRRIDPADPFFNHQAAAALWARVFGPDRLDVAVYDAAREQPDRICRAMLARLAPGARDDGFRPPAKRRAARYGPLIEAGLRAINKGVDVLPEPAGMRPVVRELAHALEDIGGLAPGAPPHPSAADIHTAFDAANRAFAHEFLGRNDNPFTLKDPVGGDAMAAIERVVAGLSGSGIDPVRLVRIARSHEWREDLLFGEGIALLRAAAERDTSGGRAMNALSAVEGEHGALSAAWDAMRAPETHSGRRFDVEDRLALVPSDAEFRDRFQASATRATRRFVIFFTPRSGSSWLTDALKNTGVLGHPGEWFNPGSFPRIAGRFKVNTFDDYCDVLLRSQKDATDVFSMEITWPQFSLIRDVDRFFFHFPPTEAPILLIRENIVRQAISLYKATETNIFHTKFTSSEDIEKSRAFREYDGASLLGNVRRLHNQERQFEALFRERGMEPLRLSYERMFADPHGTVGAIADWVGVDLPSAANRAVDNPSHTPIASTTNDEFEARFRRENRSVLAEIDTARRPLLDTLAGTPARSARTLGARARGWIGWRGRGG